MQLRDLSSTKPTRLTSYLLSNLLSETRLNGRIAVSDKYTVKSCRTIKTDRSIFRTAWAQISTERTMERDSLANSVSRPPCWNTMLALLLTSSAVYSPEGRVICIQNQFEIGPVSSTRPQKQARKCEVCCNSIGLSVSAPA